MPAPALPSKNSHCSYCGAPFPKDQPWPRTCAACRQTTYVNPLPVAVMLLPVDDGLLCIRREIEPGKGKLALPGGFIERGESWQSAAARELLEETGIVVDAADVRLFDVHSAPDGTLLVFARGPNFTSRELPAFVATNETSERTLITAPQELAFSLHTRAVREYFHRASFLS